MRYNIFNHDLVNISITCLRRKLRECVCVRERERERERKRERERERERVVWTD